MSLGHKIRFRLDYLIFRYFILHLFYNLCDEKTAAFDAFMWILKCTEYDMWKYIKYLK